MRWELAAALALLLLFAGFVARAFVQRSRLRRRLVPTRRAPRLRHPVVLAHGVLGFDEIAVAGRRHKYFRNIADQLAPLGEILSPRLPPVASVSVRAERLVELVRDIPGARVNVIAHSMGGLDARFAISRLGLGDRVASLVTIGSPHLGTPLADLPLSKATSKILRMQALRDLTPAALQRFNAEVQDFDGIAYCCVIAATNLAHTNPLLWPSHAYLSARCGPNDGLVPASSQRWGRVLREVQADHWAQVGWSLKFDAVALYEEILRELVGLGF